MGNVLIVANWMRDAVWFPKRITLRLGAPDESGPESAENIFDSGCYLNPPKLLLERIQLWVAAGRKPGLYYFFDSIV